MATLASARVQLARRVLAPGGALQQRRLLSQRVVSTSEAIRLVETKTIGRKAVAAVALKAGTVINTFVHPVLRSPLMHTVQFDDKVHVAPTDGAEFISHWCEDTNTRIVVAEDRRSAQFVTTCDVQAGDDLSFNYNTTEWSMNSPFLCACPACEASQHPRYVRGFKHLSVEDRSAIASETSPLIRDKAWEEARAHLEQLEGIHENENEVYFKVAAAAP